MFFFACEEEISCGTFVMTDKLLKFLMWLALGRQKAILRCRNANATCLAALGAQVDILASEGEVCA